MKIAYKGMKIITLANMFGADEEEVMSWAAEVNLTICNPLSESAAAAINAIDGDMSPAYAIGTYVSSDPFMPDGCREETTTIRTMRNRTSTAANELCRGISEDIVVLRRGYIFKTFRKHAQADEIASAKNEGFRQVYEALSRYECVGQRLMPNAGYAKWAAMSSRGSYRRPYTPGTASRTYTKSTRSYRK